MDATPLVFIIYKDGRAVKVVTATRYWWQSPTQCQIYMATGAVFSKATGKQMPYYMHPGITCRQYKKGQ
jgi:hypothetical protein